MPTEEPIREIGRVVRLTGELAVVEIPKAGACDGCAAHGVCHSLGGSDLRELRALNSINANVGDQVEVVVATRHALKAAMWVYLLPTLLMLVTAVAFHRVASSHLADTTAQMATALVTLLSLALFVLAAWVWRRTRPADNSKLPQVTRRLPS